MNSLAELNGYASSLTLPYTDLRAPNVLFQTASGINQSQTVDEGFSFLSSVGIEISEIINPASSAPTYTINVSAVPGTTVTWPYLPSGLTVTNPTMGIYTVSGMQTVAHWNAIKQGTITMPPNYFGLWSYISSVNYYSGLNGNQQQLWVTAVTANDVQFLTTPVNFTYQVNAVSNITNTPQLANLDVNYPNAVWTITGTPSLTSSIDTWTTTGTGGTFSVNSTTKVFTISGTRAQVNSRLAGLQIDSNTTNLDFVLTYVASNNLNSTTDTKIQVMSSVGLIYLSSPSIDYFNEDANLTNIDGYPSITDSLYDGSGGYVLTITPSNTAAVQTLTTVGSTGTSSFNPITKVLTITGTRTQVNNRLATMTMVPGTDWGSDFTLSYTVVTPRYDSATKLQTLICASNDTEISNMNISRTYVSNNGNTIFSTNTPQIIDLDTDESIYTIGFSINPSLGAFNFSANDIATSNLTFSGTRTQCNAKFANLRFWPAIGSSVSGTFTYTQLKNNVQQLSQTVGLIGSAGTWNNARTVDLLSGQIYTPEVGDALYAYAEIVLVGGGGGGSFNRGGGGGGEIVSVNGITLSQTPYTVTIGSGGLGGISSANFGRGEDGGTTSAFGYSAAGGHRGSGTGGGAGSGVLAGTGGGGATTSGGLVGGGGGGAGGAGLAINSNVQNGHAASSSTGYGGSGGTQNGYLWNGGYSTGNFGCGGGGGSDTVGSGNGPSFAGNGANSTRSAESGTDNGGGGGGGGSPLYNRPGGNGGSGRVRIRFYPK